MSSSALAGTLLTAAAAGPVVHLGIFIRGEWHLESPKIISSHLAVAGLAWWYLVRHHLGTIQEQVTLILLAFAVYVISLGSSIVTYRLFFHQLRHYPGPKLAAMSTFWKVLHCRKGKKFIALEDAHCRYGQIVRTGPNELAIFHPAAVEALDGPKSRTSRTDTFDVLQPMTSLLFTRVEEEHMAQRKIWGHATSTSAIAEYLPRIQQQVNRLADLIAKHGSRPILLNDVMSWFAFDSMGEFIFDKDFGMMDTETWHQAIIQQRNALAFFGKFVDAVWLARLGFSFFPWFGGAREWLQMVKFCDEAMQKRMRDGAKHRDIATWFIDDFTDSENLKSLKDRSNMLSGNAVSAIVAGSDTVRPTLIFVFFLLAQHPEHADKVHKELTTCDSTDANTLATLPHLEAVINESMRLYPAQLTGGDRLTSDGGLWIDDNWLPGNIKVTAPKYSILRLRTAFKHPDSFIPERWTSRPDLVLDSRAFAPFGFGTRSCVGKGIALMELRLVVAALISRYRLSFPEDQDVNSVVDGMKDRITAQPGECRLIFTPRG